MARNRIDAASRNVPQVFRLLPMFSIRNDSTTGKCMRQRTDFSHGSARRRLAGETCRSIAWRAEVTAQQMNSVNHRIDRSATSVLIHAHAPQRRDLQVRVPKHVTQHPNLCGRNAGQFFDMFGCVGFQHRLVIVE